METSPPRRHLPGWVNPLSWPQRRTAPRAFAVLERLNDLGQAAPQDSIPITSDEVTFGADPTQATVVLDDPSVEDLHARLRRDEDGSFRLADEGSVAGTWVNYAPVSANGTKVEHGDLVHIGRVGFRLMQRGSKQLRKAVIIPQEPVA